jgi:hypothetical protein
MGERTFRLSYTSLQFLVQAKLPRGLFNIWKFNLAVNKEIQHLWGGEQQQEFIRKMITVCLYKDLYGVGYDRLCRHIDIGIQVRPKSLRHNVKLIRKLLAKWAANHLVNEGCASWNLQKKNFPKKKGFEDANLIIDSTDFPLVGKSSTSRKDPKWSFKLNGPAQRFTVIVDARGKVQGVFGGYSPKLYDGDWVKLMADMLIEKFDGGHIIGDTHYETANRIVKAKGGNTHLKFYTPFAKPRGRKRKRGEYPDDLSIGVKCLTKTQLTWNQKLSHIRARVESPFGLVKSRWSSLNNPFYESEEQHDYLVRIALATHNWMIDHPPFF